jgi:hypothetical protein
MSEKELAIGFNRENWDNAIKLAPIAAVRRQRNPCSQRNNANTVAIPSKLRNSVSGPKAWKKCKRGSRLESDV